MYDIVLSTLPPIGEKIMPYGICILKQALNNEQIKCKVLDWNNDFSEKSKITCYLRWVKQLKQLNPKWIGLSIYSRHNMKIAIELLKIIRISIPEIKIVVGGKSLYINSNEQILKELGLIDHYIIGDGEKALINLLNNNLSYPGIDGNPSENIDLDEVPIPDYSDLNIKKYKIFIVSTSRGCPNNCTFCNSKIFFNELRYKNPNKVIDEIIYISNTYGIKTFYFGDYSFNSNIKQLREIAIGIKDKKLKWFGQMMYNPNITEADWKLLSYSGLFEGQFGLESGSEKVRNDMRKKFSNKDVLTMLKLMTKYNILTQLMIMVGYPTETETEFQKTLDFIKKINQENILFKVGLMHTCDIAQGSSLTNLYDFKFDDKNNWIYKDNNIDVRLKRRERLKSHCNELNLSTVDIVNHNWRSGV